VIVGTQDQAQDLYDDMPGFWRQMGEALAHGQSHMDSRLDGMDSRLSGIVDGIDGRLDRMDGRLDGMDGRLDRIDGRLDGIDGRLDRMEGDISELKTGQAATNQRLDRMERANERFSNRVDAQFERLITWIQRSEIKGS
jgi:hypothetical protein